MRPTRKPSILLACLTGAVLAGGGPASAEVTIAVTPALIELDGQAGQSGRVTVTVSDGGDEAFDLVTAIVPFEDMTGDVSAVEWSGVEPERLSLEPGADATATYTLRIPPDVPSGGRYAAISFTTVPPGGDAQAGVAGRILVPVFLTVRGEGELDRSIELVRSALFLEPDGRLGARAEVRDDGDVHVLLGGRVEVDSPTLPTTARLALQPGRVLPGTTRTYASDTTLPLPLGETYDVGVAMAPEPETGLDGPMLEATHRIVATPDLALGDLAICENLDRAPSISASLANEGDLGLASTVTFEVRDEAGAPISQTSAQQVPLWPADRIDLAGELAASLPSASYTLVASAAYGSSGSVEASLPFSIGGDPATAAPLCAATSTPSPSPQA